MQSAEEVKAVVGQAGVSRSVSSSSSSSSSSYSSEENNVERLEKANYWEELMSAIGDGVLDVAENIIGQMSVEDLTGDYASFEESNLPLHRAVQMGQEKIVKLLLSKKPDLINSTGRNLTTPLQLAYLSGHTEIFEILKEAEYSQVKEYNSEIDLSHLNLEQEEIGEDELSKDVLPLMREGNYIMQNESCLSKGMVLLGNNRAGKSTLANVLSNIELHAIKIRGQGLVLEPVTSGSPFHIGLGIGSGTKIPGRCNVTNANSIESFILDTPGFNDRSNNQEIINAFYIKQLFGIYKELKIVFVVSVHDLSDDSDKFIKNLADFFNTFKDLSKLDGAVSFVITKVNEEKTLEDLQYSIIAALEHELTKDDSRMTEEHKIFVDKIINSSLHILPKPNQEGDFNLSKLDLFAKIDSSTKYIDCSSEMIRNNFRPSIKSLSEPLWRLSTMTFSEIFELIVQGIAAATDCLTAHAENNLLIENLCFVQKVSCPQSNNLVRFIGKPIGNPYFNKLSFLSELMGILDDIKINSIQDAVDMLARSMSVFANYAENSQVEDLTLKVVMQQYGYAIRQEYELVKFFNDIHGSLLPDLQKFAETLTLCRDKVSENLRHKTHNIDLEENMTDANYYTTAVRYLNNYNSFICNNIKANAYLQLAYIAEKVTRDDCKARDLYIDAIASNPKLAAVYEKLGNLFFKYDKYENAINCYKVINKEDSIKLCFKKWLKQASIEKSDIRLQQAECFEYNRIYDRASKYYRLASSNSNDVEFRSKAMKKSAELWGMAITQQREVMLSKVETGEIPHYDLVTKDFINDLNEAKMATSEPKQLRGSKCKQ